MSIDEERPRKKKKKRKQESNTALIVGVVAGILLLVGAVVGLALVLKGNKDDSQAKAPPPSPPPVVQKDPPKYEPKPKKGKGLITAIARRAEAGEVNNLFRQLGIAYQTEDATSGRGPLKFAELGPNFASTPLKEWHDKDWVKIVWGVRISSVQSKSTTALAWETDADSAGNRVVLMCDGSVQMLHDGEFAQTAKAMGR